MSGVGSAAAGLTAEVDVSVGQRQQRRVQRVVAVAQDGVPLVDLLHHLRVETVLLHRGDESVTAAGPVHAGISGMSRAAAALFQLVLSNI